MDLLLQNNNIVMPENSTYGERYATLLNYLNFNLENPIVDVEVLQGGKYGKYILKGYNKSKLEDRKQILVELAKHYGVYTSSDSAESMFRKLRLNEEFTSFFSDKVRLIGNPTGMMKTVQYKTQVETYDSSCQEYKEFVERYIKDQATYYATNLELFSFKTFFESFFKAFESCSHLTKSIMETKTSRGIKEMLENIIYSIINNDHTAFNDVLTTVHKNQVNSKIVELTEKGIDAETAKTQAERSTKEKLRDQIFKNMFILTKMAIKPIGGKGDSERAEIIVKHINKIISDFKYSAKRIDVQSVLEQFVIDYQISLAVDTTAMLSYKTLLMKVGNDFIRYIQDALMKIKDSSIVIKGKGRKLKGSAKTGSDVYLITEENKKLIKQIEQSRQMIKKEEEDLKMFEKGMYVNGKIVKRIEQQVQEKINKIEEMKQEFNSLEEQYETNKQQEEQLNVERKLQEEKEREEKKSGKPTVPARPLGPGKFLTLREKQAQAQSSAQPTEEQANILETKINSAWTSIKIIDVLEKMFKKYIEEMFPATDYEKKEKRMKQLYKVQDVVIDEDDWLKDIPSEETLIEEQVEEVQEEPEVSGEVQEEMKSWADMDDEDYGVAAGYDEEKVDEDKLEDDEGGEFY
jgi:hypothetical protein